MNEQAKINLNAAIHMAGKFWDTTMICATVGSTIHGLNVGTSEDYDFMGVAVEPLHRVVGLYPFHQFIYRSAQVRENGNHNARSQQDDVDMTIYSLRKYVQLALKGNPSILTLLFVPEGMCQKLWNPGRDLQRMAPHIISKRAGGAFLGYMQAQKERLMGLRGGRHGVREDRINQFGYDSKYAMHIIRLGVQGRQIMYDGRLQLPMNDIDRELLTDIRQGKMPYADVIELAQGVEEDLKRAIDNSSLPNKPNEALVEQWMIDTYQRLWQIGFSK